MMAVFEFRPPKEYMDKLNALGDDDKLYKNAARAAVSPLKKHLKTALATHSKTGQLVKLIKGSVIKTREGTYFAAVRPVGDHIRKRKKQDKRMDATAIAAFIEYGTSKQPPRPYIDSVQQAALPEAAEAMQAAIDKRTEELGL